MELVFEDNAPLELLIEVDDIVFWLLAMQRLQGSELYLDELLVYPSSGTVVKAGYATVRKVFRTIELAAGKQGFVACTITATRSRTGGQKRMLTLRRLLA